MLGAALCLGQLAQAQGVQDACSVEFQVMVFSARKQVSSGTLANARPAHELPDLYFIGADGYEPIAINQTTLSPTYAYSGPTQFSLYARRDSEDGPIYTPVINVNFGREWERSIIVVTTASVGEQKSRAIAINTSEQNVPAGTILVYNLSMEELVLKAGGEIYNLRPLAPVSVPVSGIKNLTLPVQLALKDDDDYKLVYRRKWRMQPDVSGVYFLFTLSDNDRRWFMRNVIL